MTLLRISAICVLALTVALPVAADSAPIARNLVATPKLRAALRAAHLRTLPLPDRAATRGPLRHSTYYGSYGNRRYALATFWHPRVGTTDQPELFGRAPGHAWHDYGDTGGCLTRGVLPRALLRLWHLRSYC